MVDDVSSTHPQRAEQQAPSSNLWWTQVEAVLEQYGVDTGEPWSLSAAM